MCLQSFRNIVVGVAITEFVQQRALISLLPYNVQLSTNLGHNSLITNFKGPLKVKMFVNVMRLLKILISANKVFSISWAPVNAGRNTNLMSCKNWYLLCMTFTQSFCYPSFIKVSS